MIPSPRRAILLAAASLLPAGPTAAAQLPVAVDSALRAIFGARGGGGVRFGPAQWSSSGDAYTTIEGSRAGAEIVEYAAATGERRAAAEAAAGEERAAAGEGAG